jgi:hypothetical protein
LWGLHAIVLTNVEALNGNKEYGVTVEGLWAEALDITLRHGKVNPRESHY